VVGSSGSSGPSCASSNVSPPDEVGVSGTVGVAGPGLVLPTRWYGGDNVGLLVTGSSSELSSEGTAEYRPLCRDVLLVRGTAC
jgi:hypothetical protein